ncbi:hypothetical protein BU24DRAFT_3353 [Aaosphaeria arxii CBS 175.79]|uniref:Secreted protein n=1 Tax=Aaosphaeria arxii CBS 175.79 TaxID=1450172 RepID=A0A6A5Y6D5_9PLEO|nr:uncharacterized protein BU24DRAFT_3353 [Aaosphaeria arxii CBS 175.79]KAF2020577.1 hypothetical protein BU24DRAFT_3353 [Aaosphaeria arxii CBS 175.79]
MLYHTMCTMTRTLITLAQFSTTTLSQCSPSAMDNLKRSDQTPANRRSFVAESAKRKKNDPVAWFRANRRG